MNLTHLTVSGNSRSGIATALSVPALDICFDAGAFSREAGKMGSVAISHAHMDHYGALNQFLAVRWARKEELRVFLPAWLEQPTREMCEFWAAVQHQRNKYANAVVLLPGEAPVAYDERRGLHISAFRTLHRVPSQGYTVWSRRKKLNPTLAGLDGKEIAARRLAGEDVNILVDEPLVSYTGDTLSAVYRVGEPWLAAKVVITECTFIGEDFPVHEARRRGHVHIKEIIDNPEPFRACERLVLTHASRRHGVDEYKAARDRLPDWLAEKTIMHIEEEA